MKILWMVKIFDGDAHFSTETFDTRGKASAYAMRWNKQPGLRWRAELLRVEVA